MRRHYWLPFVAMLLCAFFARASVADVNELSNTLRSAAAELKTMEPVDSPEFQKLLKILPKDQSNNFLVEGDISLNEHELEDYVLDLAAGSERTAANPELLLNVVNGVQDYYEDFDKRRLTYAIDKKSFGTSARYSEIVDLMAKATKAWEDVCPACGIRFVHVQAEDAVPKVGPVNFVVQAQDAGGMFIAKAFFPHNKGSDRVLLIDPSFYNGEFAKQGVLEHELGHVLGYRHEQIVGIPGCSSEGGKWIALTAYDSKSVMHYFCGGGGSHDMKISATDRAGHRLLYSQH
ncbi:matrixin family metalloprotease [Rhizobium ruizarguesonis]|uniref:matrixin family metalloprotease n=1 Tax=Rhizobium ruizarguesonis TaxID=2081791 RepID=UPI00117B1C50|nr:matrixin family metalloprotease [Rhizobium ruizarguesonis]UED34242.1 hypothetical protein BSO17_24355 [Rhizobium ruizarguesonis]